MDILFSIVSLLFITRFADLLNLKLMFYLLKLTMIDIFVYCKTCGKKVKAVVLTKHEKEYDESISGYRRYGMVKILEHNIGFKTNCSDTSQIKAIVESDSKDDNSVFN